MIGIYKITNKINNKSYIGQSVHIERRWVEHCMPHTKSQIANAIKEFGKENFLFEIIEECEIFELDEKENYWIKYFNTIVPNGYNVAENTESTHTTYYSYSKEVLLRIIFDLKETTLSLVDIANKYNLDKSTISRINSGSIHKQEELEYPIRKTNFNYRQEKTCIDCGKKISFTAIRCVQCEGKHRIKDLPISREELKYKIRTMSFVAIGKEFKISDNAIKKWCDKYNLPRTKKEIKNYSDEEWLNI